MKIISLNMWGGRVKEPLTEFLKKYADVDVFLFQEIIHGTNHGGYGNPADDERVHVDEILTNHVGYYRPAMDSGFGLGIFVKKGVKVESEGEIFVHSSRDAILPEKWWLNVGKNLQHVQIMLNGEKITIFNLHGLWEQSGKGDSADRIKQSEKVIAYMNQFEGGKILCGDFNIRPDTQSLKLIKEQVGLKDLITEYNIPTTRTSFYTKTDERFADYILVSHDILVKDFQAMPDEVSDHMALYLEI